MTDSNGNFVWRSDNKPFGEVQITTGTVENNKQFIGKEKDKETGLYYFGARYMEPRIGRFMSPDPVGPVDPKTSKTNYKMLTNPQKLKGNALSRLINMDGGKKELSALNSNCVYRRPSG
ncbi:MAG: RHS repeat-associated core domain-containing protein [Nitrospirota bacterium]